MKRGRRISTEEKIKIATQICELYAKDRHTLADCAKKFDLTDTTFYAWAHEIGEIGEAFEKAKKTVDFNFNKRIEQKAKRLLEKKLDGYEVEDEDIIYDVVDGQLVEKERKVKKKRYVASDTLIQVTLYNRDPDSWKDKRNVEHTGKDGQEITFKVIGDETKIRDSEQ